MEPASKSTFSDSTKFSLWLSWQELNGRKVVFSINVIIVALLIALPVSLDLLAKARKSSIDTKVDYIGPSLILVPNGILSSDLVTAKLKGKTYSFSTFQVIQRDFKKYLRNAEVRLTERLNVEGKSLPVVGIDFRNVYSYPFSGYLIGSNEVLLGAVAARKLQKDRNDTLMVGSQDFRVAGIIPTTGAIDDVSVFFSLPVLQKLTGHNEKINEIRLFPESVLSYERLKSLLTKYSGRLNIIDAYRGDTAEKDVESTLVSYQKALYTAAFILIAFCIMISTYINLDGRKSEVSTVYTLGATHRIIFQLLTFRTVWITIIGATIGHLIALFVTTLQAQSVPLRFIWSTGSFIEVTLSTVCLGILVTIPFAFYSVYKSDPVAQL